MLDKMQNQQLYSILPISHYLMKLYILNRYTYTYKHIYIYMYIQTYTHINIMNNGLSVPSNDPVECIALELSEWGLSKEQMDIQTEKMSLIK